MIRALILVATLVTAAAPATARSNAASYLIDQEIADACEGREGNIDPAAVIERDLTGDGRADLIISHEGIECSDGRRSNACGMQVCSVMIYVRRGELLQVEVNDLLGMAVSVDGGEIPIIRMYGHGGRPATIMWNGQNFGPVN